MVAANTIPEIDYTTKDFLAAKALARQFIQLYYSDRITNFNDSSLNMMEIEITSLFFDIVMFYLDRQANEAILATATRRQSVIDILQTIDYQLSTALPATDDLTVTIDPTNAQFPGYPATLPARFRVSNGNPSDPVYFETEQPLIFLNSDTVKTVPIFEGVTVTETGANALATSDGSQNQAYQLSTAGVIVPTDPNEFAVEFVLTVGGVTWNRVIDFVDAQSTDEVYTVTVDENDFATVTFGNGSLGKIPSSGNLIEVTYRVGGGERGNIGPNTLTKIISNVPWVVSVSNNINDGASGGTDRESISDAKLLGPKDLRTLRRAVSDQDHADIALLVDGVAKAITDPTPGSISMNVYIAPAGGGNPSQALINAVLNAFQTAKMAPTIIFVLPPFYQPTLIDYTLRVNKGFKQADVAANVLTQLQSLTSFDSIDFGVGISLMTAYELVKDNVQGVDGFVITRFTIDPTFRANQNNTGRPTFSSVTVFPTVQQREWYIVMLSSTTFSVTMREKGNSTTISNTQLQDTNVSWLLNNGTSTGVGTSYLDDTTKTLVVNAYEGQTLIDSAGTPFLITSNTATRYVLSAGTPATGAYKIVRRFVGLSLNPSDKNNTYTTIVANTENTLTTADNLNSLAKAGDEYSIETLQSNTGTMGTRYEDDAATFAFTMSSGSIAPVIGDNWIMRTSAYLSDIATPTDVLLEAGTFNPTIFGGELT